jgi:hypothetical protein
MDSPGFTLPPHCAKIACLGPRPGAIFIFSLRENGRGRSACWVPKAKKTWCFEFKVCIAMTLSSWAKFGVFFTLNAAEGPAVALLSYRMNF